MLPRSRAGDPRPAPARGVVDEGFLGEAALLAYAADTADDVEPPARECGTGGRACLGKRRQPAPALPVPGHGKALRLAFRIAADDVQTTSAGRRHRVVDAERKVGEARPAVAGRIVEIDASRARPVLEKASDDGDLPVEERTGHLGSRQW